MRPVFALTGATGFVGRSIVRAIRRDRPDAGLRLLVRNPQSRTMPEAFSGCEIVAGDLHNPDALNTLVRNSDCVIHVAAAIAGNSAESFEHHNTGGTRRLLDAITATAPEAHLVHLSSLAARQPELSWYAASKRAAEEIVASRARRFSILRPPAVYGPDDPALATFWRMLHRGWMIRPGPADARFSLVHVEDLASAVCRLAGTGPASTTLTLAGPQPDAGWSWAELAAVAERSRGKTIRIVAVPPPVLGAGARLGLIVSRLMRKSSMLSPGKARELLHRNWVCDNLDLEQCLDWKPTTRLERALGTLPGWSDR